MIVRNTITTIFSSRKYHAGYLVMGKYAREFLPHPYPPKPKKRKPKSPTYHQRNLILKELGFVDTTGHASYFNYLRSSLWHAIRRRAYKIHGHNCKLCPRKATTIHHLSYTRTVLLGQDYTQLAPLCKICHNRVELHRGRKRKLIGAQHSYTVLLAKRMEQIKALTSLNSKLPI